MNQGDTYEVQLQGLDESFMAYDSASNSIIVDKSMATFGKHVVEITIVDALKAKSTSTFEIDIEELVEEEEEVKEEIKPAASAFGGFIVE